MLSRGLHLEVLIFFRHSDNTDNGYRLWRMVFSVERVDVLFSGWLVSVRREVLFLFCEWRWQLKWKTYNYRRMVELILAFGLILPLCCMIDDRDAAAPLCVVAVSSLAPEHVHLAWAVQSGEDGRD